MHKLAMLFALSAFACGNDHAIEPDAAGPTDGFRTLISGPWTLSPSSEKYVCVRLTVTEDTYIKTIRPVAPVGTHHTVLMLGAPDAPDGTVDCTSALARPAIYASGVGTLPLEMPAGVAVHVRPGQQLLLNLHLFNASDVQLDGLSGVEILEVDAASVQHEAGVVLVGKAIGLQVPPGDSTQTGKCTTPAGATVFAVMPHMHLMGRHMKVSYAETGGANARVVFDEDYSFDEQRFHLIDPQLVTAAGAKVTVDCTYFNPTGTTNTFGESTEQEMCFALSFVYPPPPVEECVQ